MQRLRLDVARQVEAAFAAGCQLSIGHSGRSLASDAPGGIGEAGELVACLGGLLAHLFFGERAEALAQGELGLFVQARSEEDLQHQFAALFRVLRAGLAERIAESRIDRAVADEARNAVARRAGFQVGAAAVQREERHDLRAVAGEPRDHHAAAGVAQVRGEIAGGARDQHVQPDAVDRPWRLQQSPDASAARA